MTHRIQLMPPLPSMPPIETAQQETLNQLCGATRHRFDASVQALKTIPIDAAFDGHLDHWVTLRRTLRQLTQSPHRQNHFTHIAQHLRRYKQVNDYHVQWELRKQLAEAFFQPENWQLFLQATHNPTLLNTLQTQWYKHAALAHLNDQALSNLRQTLSALLTQLHDHQRDITHKRSQITDATYTAINQWATSVAEWIKHYQQTIEQAMLARLSLHHRGRSDVLLDLIETLIQNGVTNTFLTQAQTRLIPIVPLTAQRLSHLTAHVLQSPLAQEARHRLSWLHPSADWQLDEYANEWRLIPTPLASLTPTLKQTQRRWYQILQQQACTFSQWLTDQRHVFVEHRLLMTLFEQPIQAWYNSPQTYQTLLQRLAIQQQHLTQCHHDLHTRQPSRWNVFRRTTYQRIQQTMIYLTEQQQQLQHLEQNLARHGANHLLTMDKQLHTDPQQNTQPTPVAMNWFNDSVLQITQTALQQTTLETLLHQITHLHQHHAHTRRQQQAQQWLDRLNNSLSLNTSQYQWLTHHLPQMPALLTPKSRIFMHVLTQLQQDFEKGAKQWEHFVAQPSNEALTQPLAETLTRLQAASAFVRTLAGRRILDHLDHFVVQQLRQISCDLLSDPRHAHGHAFCKTRLTLLTHIGNPRHQQAAHTMHQAMHTDLNRLKQQLRYDLLYHDRQLLFRYRPYVLDHILHHCIQQLTQAHFSNASIELFSQCAQQVFAGEPLYTVLQRTQSVPSSGWFQTTPVGMNWYEHQGLAKTLLNWIAATGEALSEQRLAPLCNESTFAQVAHIYRQITTRAASHVPGIQLFAPPRLFPESDPTSKPLTRSVQP